MLNSGCGHLPAELIFSPAPPRRQKPNRQYCSCQNAGFDTSKFLLPPSPPPLLPSPSLLVPPETTVCDYKRTITPPKASRCNTFSLPSFISSAVKLFFQVLIFHFQYENITIRGREGGREGGRNRTAVRQSNERHR